MFGYSGGANLPVRPPQNLNGAWQYNGPHAKGVAYIGAGSNNATFVVASQVLDAFHDKGITFVMNRCTRLSPNHNDAYPPACRTRQTRHTRPDSHALPHATHNNSAHPGLARALPRAHTH